MKSTEWYVMYYYGQHNQPPHCILDIGVVDSITQQSIKLLHQLIMKLPLMSI